MNRYWIPGPITVYGTTERGFSGEVQVVLAADAERLQAVIDARDKAEARLAEAERDIAQWKKVYDLRGRALQRPCTNCGYVPLVIHTDAIDAARASDSADMPLTPDGHCAKCGGTVGLSHRCTTPTVSAGQEKP